jgi:hypothetical protein
MISAALIGAGGAASGEAGDVVVGAAAGGDGAAAGEEAGGAVGAAAASASAALSEHAPSKNVASGGRAGRGTGASYRKSRGTRRANYLCAER